MWKTTKNYVDVYKDKYDPQQTPSNIEDEKGHISRDNIKEELVIKILLRYFFKKEKMKRVIVN